MLTSFIDTFKIELDEEFEDEFKLSLNLNNAEKIVLISGLGVLFFLLLSLLDIQRINSGEFFESNYYLGLTITHVLLGFLIVPGYIVYKNVHQIRQGDYTLYNKMLVLCLFIMGLSLVPMSVFGSIDKRGLVTFAAYIIIANLVFTLDKKTRIIVNVLSAIAVIIGIIYIHWNDIITLIALTIEVLGIGFPVYIISTYQYNLRVKQFTNEKTLEKQNIIIQQNLKKEYDRRIAETEMKALRAQMNPHFLFNVLNSIKLFMVQNDAQKASIYLTKFSRLIRLILNNSKNKMVCLSDELEALKLYIEMENFRFDNKFDYSIRIDEEIEKDIIKIPPLILQPYVENAIWHGLMHKEDGRGKLAIDISQKANTIKFIIEDNGIGREKSKTLNTTLATTHQSVGMEITKDRIMRTNELYGLTADIEVIDSEDSKTGKSAGTKVIIQLPVR
jgi:sensor histidine kinase YesM